MSSFLCPSVFLVPLSSVSDASIFCSLSTFQVLSLSVSTSKHIRIFWHHLHHTKPLLPHIGGGFGIWGQYKCFFLQNSDNKGSIFSMFGNVAVLMVHSVLYSSLYPQSLDLFKATERIRLNDALEGAYWPSAPHLSPWRAEFMRQMK